MSAPPSLRTVSKPEQEDLGAVIPLTKRLRTLLGALFAVLSLAHIARPTLGIDAVSIGLVVAAVVIIFFDVDGFEWKGVKARRLQRNVEHAESIVASVTVPTEKIAPPASPSSTEFQPGAPGFEGVVHQPILELNPPVDRLERFLWAYEQIRIELIVISGNAGIFDERVTFDRYQPRRLTASLIASSRIPEGLGEPVGTITRLRNEVVHSTTKLSRDLLDSSADLAIDVLLKLRSVKRNYIRVRNPDVHLFRDQSLSQYHEARGVELASFDEAGLISAVGVFPRMLLYAHGRFVSWEWTLDRVFDNEAWYHDSESNLAKPAFSESATFAGREYPAQWGLEYRLPRPDAGLTGGAP